MGSGSPARTAPARVSLRLTTFFESSPLLQCGFLHRLQTELLFTYDLRGLEGLSLLSCHILKAAPECLSDPFLTVMG